MAVKIEGMSVEELLALPDHEFQDLVLNGRPITFKAGSAEVLGQFEVREGKLRVELAHIDGGGEGVLPTLAVLAHRLAAKRSLSAIEWLVYATNCAAPNPKLRPVLDRRGFTVQDIDGKGPCYYKVEPVRGVLPNKKNAADADRARNC